MATKPKSRRKKTSKPLVTKTGAKVTEAYCRKCMQTKKPSLFYTAMDFFLDANGLMSICKECVNDMYDRIYQNEMSIDKTILRLCKILNIKFDIRAVESVKAQIATREATGRKSGSIFGVYKTRLAAVQKTAVGQKHSVEEDDYTFHEPASYVGQELDEEDVGIDTKEYLETFWGQKLSLVDYEFLEQELAKWKQTTKCDSYSELVLIKEICFKQNEIRKKRIEGKSVVGDVKNLQELMKNSALTPSQQNVAGAGRSQEIFGVWVDDLERFMPAEWHDQQELYRDMDDINEYGEKYIVRSIKNFITGSRDFNLSEIVDEEDDNGVFDD